MSQMFLFSLPIMATTVIQLLFNTADTIVAGRWGGNTPEECEIVLAAVGSCGALISLIITLFMGLSVGSGVAVSHAVGAKHYERIHDIIHTSIATGAIGGILLAVFGVVFARPLLVLMGTNTNVMHQAVLYMRAYFFGIPAQLVYNYCAAMLRSTGDSTRPLYFLSVAGVVNICMNLIMVLVFHMGALGVGVATAASQWVSCIMILIYMIRNDGLCHFRWRSLKIIPSVLKSILMIGVPAGIQNSMYAIGNVVMQTGINSLNSTVIVSGSSIASNLGAYTQQTVGAFDQATQVFVGQNTGARNIKRIRKGVLFSSITVVILSIGVNILLNLFSEPLLMLYAPDNAEVVAFARIKLLTVSMCYFLGHLASLPAVAMRGMGKSTQPMIISVLGICGVRILWVYTVFAKFRHPLVLFAAYGVSWLVTAVVLYIVYGVEQKKIGVQWEKDKSKKSDKSDKSEIASV